MLPLFSRGRQCYLGCILAIWAALHHVGSNAGRSGHCPPLSSREGCPPRAPAVVINALVVSSYVAHFIGTVVAVAFYIG